MLRIPDGTDPLLGRPFAFYDTAVDAHGLAFALDLVYLVVGKMTGLLSAQRPGKRLDIWGPLGNGFPEPASDEHVGLVAGGIGQTPFLAYARELLGQKGYGGRPPQKSVRRVSLYYGVRSADLAAGVRRLSPGRRGDSLGHRRRKPRFPRLCDSVIGAASAASAPGRLRSRANDEGPERPRKAMGSPVPPVVGDTDGVRPGHLFQLRHASANTIERRAVCNDR